VIGERAQVQYLGPFGVVSVMDAKSVAKKLEAICKRSGTNLEVFYQVSTDSDNYPVEKVELLEADEAIAEKCGMSVGDPYILLKSSAVW
jgi:hypothetical protein